MKTKVLQIFFALLVLISSSFISNSYCTTINMNVSNFAFTPNSATALVGDTLKWTWISGNHTTSSTSVPGGAATWNSPMNSGLTQFKYVITVAGTYNLRCNIHTSMTAVITATSPVINLNLTAIFEGLWNGTVMIGDTAKVFLHSSTSPFAKIDSAKVKLSSSGTGAFIFTHSSSGSYYIVVNQRNTIQTWSKLPIAMTTGGTISYDFTTAADKAFGDNQILKIGKFTIYSGDVNLDQSINLSDVIQIQNDASVFVTGYVSTDVNGDNMTDLSDILIAHNNSINFVAVSKPTILNND